MLAPAAGRSTRTVILKLSSSARGPRSLNLWGIEDTGRHDGLARSKYLLESACLYSAVAIVSFVKALSFEIFHADRFWFLTRACVGVEENSRSEWFRTDCERIHFGFIWANSVESFGQVCLWMNGFWRGLKSLCMSESSSSVVPVILSPKALTADFMKPSRIGDCGYVVFVTLGFC